MWWAVVSGLPRLWEVPALLTLGTVPGMRPWSFPSAWEAPVPVEQLGGRQRRGLGDHCANTVEPAVPAVWFLIWVISPPRGGGDLYGESWDSRGKGIPEHPVRLLDKSPFTSPTLGACRCRVWVGCPGSFQLCAVLRASSHPDLCGLPALGVALLSPRSPWVLPVLRGPPDLRRSNSADNH